MPRKAQTIFIQIASYRDPQLIPTIKNLLTNAKRPKNLRFGICRQYHPQDKFDDLSTYHDDERFRIKDVLYTETKGVCWARHHVQQLYDDEMYTLQIDSHMRFVKGWDDMLIKMIKQLQEKGFPKPLLTAYVPSFDPDNDPESRIQEPWRMTFDRFIPEGAIFFLPETIPDWKNIQAPVPARFYSAHMAFTLGEFSVEVQHNPEYYFHGEEISIAVRAFTHGYDLFHPHRLVIWHEYTRKGRVKQWDDDEDWGNKNYQSHLTNRKLFGMDGAQQEGHDSPYGFGTIRTLQGYEEYAGLLFESRGVQQYTLDKKYPPNPGIKALGGIQEWKNSFLSIFKHCIDIQFNSLPEDDYNFWAVAFHDRHSETIYRRDADREEIKQILDPAQEYVKIWREFPTSELPDYWVVWPFSASKGWCERLTGKLNNIV